MKNTLLFKTAVLGAASAFTIGAAAVPFASFASEASGEVTVQQNGPRGNQQRGIGGPYGTVTGIDDHGDGTGTITLTLAVPERPVDAPALDEDVLARIESRIEAFFEKHPDAPRPGDSITVEYDSETKFMIGGEEASVDDVTVGMSIAAHGVRPETDEAAALITDAAPRPRGEHGRPGQQGERSRGMIGEVASVDADENTVTITLPDESDGKFTVGQQVHVGAFVQLNLGEQGSEE